MYQLFIDTTHTSLPPTQTDQYLSNWKLSCTWYHSVTKTGM
jgi:hypothetical protein